MDPTDVVLVVLAGTGAGVINTVVGSGTLIVFPLLLSVGVPPVAANVANTIGFALLPAGSVVGGLIGARLGRVLPPLFLRVVIVVVGVYGIVQLVR